MNAHADKTQENKVKAVANDVSKQLSSNESTFQFLDNRPEAIAQRKLQEMANTTPQAIQMRKWQKIAHNSPHVKQRRVFQEMANSNRRVAQLNSDQEQSGGNLIVDEGATAGPNQMTKSDFLRELERTIKQLAKEILEPAGMSQEGDCPELAYWIDYYLRQDAAHVETAIARYAPAAANAKSARESLTVVEKRIRAGFEANAASRSLDVEPGPTPKSAIQESNQGLEDRVSQRKYGEAIQRRIFRPSQVQPQRHAFFNKDNLIFITQSDGRLPTLYFDNDATQGRLRQEHPKGPKARQGMIKVRAFVPGKYAGHPNRLFRDLDRLNVKTLKQYYELPPALRQPKNGSVLVEWKVSGGTLKGRHVSGGIVSTNLAAYTDAEILRIANTIGT